MRASTSQVDQVLSDGLNAVDIPTPAEQEPLRMGDAASHKNSSLTLLGLGTSR